jgi:hypothetical protein
MDRLSEFRLLLRSWLFGRFFFLILRQQRKDKGLLEERVKETSVEKQL